MSDDWDWMKREDTDEVANSNVVKGPLCPRGCNEPVFVETRGFHTFVREEHDCPRAPAKLLVLLLERIGSWTNARWDQHARYEAGDVAADELIAWLEDQNICPYRGKE